MINKTLEALAVTGMAIHASEVAEKALEYSEAKCAESKAAMKHWDTMYRQWGEDHPVTLQAYQFAKEANEKAALANMVAKNAHKAAENALKELSKFVN